ncbi:hypothetical protein QWZ04_13970 [Vibrio tapetis subsp. quintayensis]|uniref:hypothetical protein n=1 Tax=Vibrio tapetis TaxID=52443 RepID=UPI0025B5B723|nr:hypothetical protein [Vibrio tapetis]MDN3681430.1 hypothetical protein [Vibrio tapetis subsp. quintayensis]
MKQFIVSILLFAISGCADLVEERQGTAIEVVPITYSLQLNIKNNDVKAVKQKLDDFVEQHWNMVSNQSVSLTWNSKKAEKLSKDYLQYLISLGLDREKLSLSKQEFSADDEREFDIKIDVLTHSAVVPLCDYYRLDQSSQQRNEGCFAETNRWISMTNPEKPLEE